MFALQGHSGVYRLLSGGPVYHADLSFQSTGWVFLFYWLKDTGFTGSLRLPVSHFGQHLSV